VFKKVVIVGVGLIGASIAAALKKRALAECVVGIDQSLLHQDLACRLGWIDVIGAFDDSTLQDCELLVFCTPVAIIPALYEQVLPFLSSSAIVTDVGSTKAHLAHCVFPLMQPDCAVFIPGHPIAGSQRSGPEAADSDLFEDRVVVLTPFKATPAWALTKLSAVWQALGSRVVEGSPDWHDAVFAEVSHVPHLLAALAICGIDHHAEASDLWALAGTGLRDFTRIGAGHPEMWRDICLENRDAILVSLQRYSVALEQLMQQLEGQDAKALYALFDQARLARTKRWD
jgi:prephenate dehydrogenase